MVSNTTIRTAVTKILNERILSFVVSERNI